MPTPLDWLNYLYPTLVTRAARMGELDAYYRGDHPLPFVTKAHDAKMRDEFRRMLEESRSNFMRLVVDATEERLKVEGFRLSASTDEQTDKAAWDIWQANGMDAQAQTAFLEALVKSVSYLSVWAGDDYPTMAVEDPCETIVAYTPGSNYRAREAAIKVWKDELAGEVRANVYTPDGITKFVRPLEQEPKKRPGQVNDAAGAGDKPKWEEIAGSFVENPVGVVPIVPLRNHPRLGCEGESEIADVISIQQQINGALFLEQLAMYMSAHRQRWVVGLTLMEDPNTGKPKEPFDVAVDKLWQSEDPETKFGEFSQTDLDGYIKAIEQKVQHIAVISRTPRHYLLPEGQEPSGDSIRSAESGLVKKVEERQQSFGEGIEEAIRLARLFAGKEDAPVDSEVVWGDPATPTQAQITDSVVKLFQAGLVPHEVALEMLGVSQTQIRRIMAGATQDALLAALNPQPAPEVAQTNGNTPTPVAA